MKTKKNVLVTGGSRGVKSALNPLTGSFSEVEQELKTNPIKSIKTGTFNRVITAILDLSFKAYLY